MPHSSLQTTSPLVTGWEICYSLDVVVPSEWSLLRFENLSDPTARPAVCRGFRDRTIDELNVYFRCSFAAVPPQAGQRAFLQFDGLATLATVWLNGCQILTSDSMFARHRTDVSPLLSPHNELLIECRALTPALKAHRRSLPLLRWKTRVVVDQQLRFFRTTISGRSPGFSSQDAPVGPWQPVSLVLDRQLLVQDWQCRTEVMGQVGFARISFRLVLLDPSALPVRGKVTVGDSASPLVFSAEGESVFVQATVAIPDVRLWWLHTHGEPVLYRVTAEMVLADDSAISVCGNPCGFRTVTVRDAERNFGFQLNGVPVFCRGVIWTPVAGSAAERLRLLCDAGFNLIRIPGTTHYQDDQFHLLCDSLGLLVWQDMMFANMDYPFGDAAFLAASSLEARTVLARLSHHPSTALICGNSEVEQQACMFGVSAADSRPDFFSQLLPQAVKRCCPGLPYIPSAPFGGDLPFRTDHGVANYFGVGAYLRPLGDARLAEVRFASECLAFANVPEPDRIDEIAAATPGGISPVHPAWKRGVPRDCGAGWDFEDVRDHYLKLLYAVEPAELRYFDVTRYWELSRMTSAEVMFDVFAEWRRPASSCQGGIILWSADTVPGAGWGILDHCGCPKAPYYFLKRLFQPCSVFLTGEGLNGVDVHVTNENSSARQVQLRITLYKECEQLVEQTDILLELAAREVRTLGVEEVLGHFADASYAYRFGPPGHNVIVATLNDGQSGARIGQAFHFPHGRNLQRFSLAEMGLSCDADPLAEGNIRLRLRSTKIAYGVQIHAPHCAVSDSYFSIECGGEQTILLSPLPSTSKSSLTVTITAVNLRGKLIVPFGTRA